MRAACDAVLDERGACPSCGKTPAPRDVIIVGPGKGPFRADAVSAALQRPRRLLQPLIVDE
jgi:hypothetical protein